MLYGIEQEIALIRKSSGEFVDFTNTRGEELQKIIDKLPFYQKDYPRLRVGDLKIKLKRWYLEGVERFRPDGSFEATLPKGIEIRTVPRTSPEKVLADLRSSYLVLRKLLKRSDFFPVCVSYHPFTKKYSFDPPLNSYERKMRSVASSPEAATADITLLSYGPDLNLSFPGMMDKELVDAGRKLTYYSPGMIPFSFSSPFYDGKLWDGLSVRTYLRTGRRPAVMVFLKNKKNMVKTNPSLRQVSRIPFERGRIEFKAFDTCRDLGLYDSLFALLEGVVLDKTLTGRASVPDGRLHQRSARRGFEDKQIYKLGSDALSAAERALPRSKRKKLARLWQVLKAPEKLPVYEMVRTYQKNKSIIKTLLFYENIEL